MGVRYPPPKIYLLGAGCLPHSDHRQILKATYPMTKTDDEPLDPIGDYARVVSREYRWAINEKISTFLNDFEKELKETVMIQFIEMAKQVTEDCFRARFTGETFPPISKIEADQSTPPQSSPYGNSQAQK